jgi:hypothetical protein
MRRAAKYDGVVPVRGDLLSSLTPAQMRDVILHIRGLRSPHAPFDVIQLGQTAGLPPEESRAMVRSYADAGVNWWIETMPFESQQLDQIRRRARLGPPA